MSELEAVEGDLAPEDRVPTFSDAGDISSKDPGDWSDVTFAFGTSSRAC